MGADAVTPSAVAAALNRELSVKLRAIARDVARQLTRRGLTASGALRLGETSAHDGVLPQPSGGTGHEQGAEPPLGNPSTSGQALTSTPGGVRAWLDVATQAELDAHVAAADPHPVYLTQPEGDARYTPVGAGPTGAAGGALAGTYPNPTLAPIAGLTPGAYTNATVQVDATGRVTAVNSGTISGATEPFGVAFNNAGEVALRNDGTIATKRF